ncbi:MAG: hypothetical protein GXO42_00325 [bacterium]|nr:hypothetical protein [bacterium]
MLIASILKKYIELFIKYSELQYLFLIFSAIIFLVTLFLANIEGEVVTAVLYFLGMFFCGVYCSLVAALTEYFFLGRLPEDVAKRNLLAGVVLGAAGMFLALLQLTWQQLFFVFFLYYLLVVVVCYTVEPVGLRRAALVSLIYIIKYVKYSIITFIVYFLLGCLGAVLTSASSPWMLAAGALLAAAGCGLLAYLQALLYLSRYSSYKEIIFRELCSRKS